MDGRQHSSRDYVNEAVCMALIEELHSSIYPLNENFSIAVPRYRSSLPSVYSETEPGVDETPAAFAYRHNHSHLLTVCHTNIIFYVCPSMEMTREHCTFLLTLKFQVLDILIAKTGHLLQKDLSADGDVLLRNNIHFLPRGFWVQIELNIADEMQ